MSWKKNWTPSLRSIEKSIVKQNSFRVLSILYILKTFVKQENKILTQFEYFFFF